MAAVVTKEAVQKAVEAVEAVHKATPPSVLRNRNKGGKLPGRHGPPKGFQMFDPANLKTIGVDGTDYEAYQPIVKMIHHFGAPLARLKFDSFDLSWLRNEGDIFNLIRLTNLCAEFETEKQRFFDWISDQHHREVDRETHSKAPEPKIVRVTVRIVHFLQLALEILQFLVVFTSGNKEAEYCCDRPPGSPPHPIPSKDMQLVPCLMRFDDCPSQYFLHTRCTPVPTFWTAAHVHTLDTLVKLFFQWSKPKAVYPLFKCAIIFDHAGMDKGGRDRIISRSVSTLAGDDSKILEMPAINCKMSWEQVKRRLDQHMPSLLGRPSPEDVLIWTPAMLKQVSVIWDHLQSTEDPEKVNVRLHLLLAPHPLNVLTCFPEPINRPAFDGDCNALALLASHRLAHPTNLILPMHCAPQKMPEALKPLIAALLDCVMNGFPGEDINVMADTVCLERIITSLRQKPGIELMLENAVKWLQDVVQKKDDGGKEEKKTMGGGGGNGHGGRFFLLTKLKHDVLILVLCLLVELAPLIPTIATPKLPTTSSSPRFAANDKEGKERKGSASPKSNKNVPIKKKPKPSLSSGPRHKRIWPEKRSRKGKGTGGKRGRPKKIKDEESVKEDDGGGDGDGDGDGTTESDPSAGEETTPVRSPVDDKRVDNLSHEGDNDDEMVDPIAEEFSGTVGLGGQPSPRHFAELCLKAFTPSDPTPSFWSHWIPTAWFRRALKQEDHTLLFILCWSLNSDPMAKSFSSSVPWRSALRPELSVPDFVQTANLVADCMDHLRHTHHDNELANMMNRIFKDLIFPIAPPFVAPPLPMPLPLLSAPVLPLSPSLSSSVLSSPPIASPPSIRSPRPSLPVSSPRPLPIVSAPSLASSIPSTASVPPPSPPSSSPLPLSTPVILISPPPPASLPASPASVPPPHLPGDASAKIPKRKRTSTTQADKEKTKKRKKEKKDKKDKKDKKKEDQKIEAVDTLAVPDDDPEPPPTAPQIPASSFASPFPPIRSLSPLPIAAAPAVSSAAILSPAISSVISAVISCSDLKLLQETDNDAFTTLDSLRDYYFGQGDTICAANKRREEEQRQEAHGFLGVLDGTLHALQFSQRELEVEVVAESKAVEEATHQKTRRLEMHRKAVEDEANRLEMRRKAVEDEANWLEMRRKAVEEEASEVAHEMEMRRHHLKEKQRRNEVAVKHISEHSALIAKLRAESEDKAKNRAKNDRDEEEAVTAAKSLFENENATLHIYRKSHVAVQALLNKALLS